MTTENKLSVFKWSSDYQASNQPTIPCRFDRARLSAQSQKVTEVCRVFMLVCHSVVIVRKQIT